MVYFEVKTDGVKNGSPLNPKYKIDFLEVDKTTYTLYQCVQDIILTFSAKRLDVSIIGRSQTEHFLSVNGPPHDKTNKMTCAPREDSGQPGHPPRLIRVFAVR